MLDGLLGEIGGFLVALVGGVIALIFYNRKSNEVARLESERKAAELAAKSRAEVIAARTQRTEEVLTNANAVKAASRDLSDSDVDNRLRDKWSD